MSHLNTVLHTKRQQKPGRQAGFTLIEVLVTVIILAIGVTGVASLQISTYSQLQSSHNLATASMLAGEMADRMTANAAQVLANSYIHLNPTSLGTDCAATNCTTAELAAFDVSTWQSKITSGAASPGSLPAGQGLIVRSTAAATPNDFTIIVQWDDDLSGSAARTCDANDPAALDCYSITVRH